MCIRWHRSTRFCWPIRGLFRPLRGYPRPTLKSTTRISTFLLLLMPRIPFTRRWVETAGGDTGSSDMELDLLILPGGVISGQIAKGEVLAWLRGEAKHVPIIASVSNGALVLGAAGLLDGRVATMHWEDVSALQELCPTIHIERNMRYVDTGEVVTSAGVSAGIDMSLHLIDRLLRRRAGCNYSPSDSPGRWADGCCARRMAPGPCAGRELRPSCFRTLGAHSTLTGQSA